MADGYLVEAYEGLEARLQDVPLDRKAVDGVGPVKHNDGDLLLGRRLHAISQGGGVGVEPGADVLDVEDEGLDAIEHLDRGLHHFTIKAVDGYARDFVDR